MGRPFNLPCAPLELGAMLPACVEAVALTVMSIVYVVVGAVGIAGGVAPVQVDVA